MCKLCDEGKPQAHSNQGSRWDSRRGFLKASAGAGAAAGLSILAPQEARADDNDRAPDSTGHRDRRYLIRGGAVMSMDKKVGDFAQADVPGAPPSSMRAGAS
jgi:5-methylthioadenosine/S-adenosylhomocysteine deaminase